MSQEGQREKSSCELHVTSGLLEAGGQRTNDREFIALTAALFRFFLSGDKSFTGQESPTKETRRAGIMTPRLSETNLCHIKTAWPE